MLALYLPTDLGCSQGWLGPGLRGLLLDLAICVCEQCGFISMLMLLSARIRERRPAFYLPESRALVLLHKMCREPGLC